MWWHAFTDMRNSLCGSMHKHLVTPLRLGSLPQQRLHLRFRAQCHASKLRQLRATGLERQHEVRIFSRPFSHALSDLHAVAQREHVSTRAACSTSHITHHTSHITHHTSHLHQPGWHRPRRRRLRRGKLQLLTPPPLSQHLSPTTQQLCSPTLFASIAHTTSTSSTSQPSPSLPTLRADNRSCASVPVHAHA